MTLTEISTGIDAPKNSTSRLIETLMARGYVARDGGAQRFRLTSKLLRLGLPRAGEVSLIECALPAMRALRDVLGETVQLGIPSGDEGVLIEQVESTRSVRVVANLGLRFLLHNNAPGKVLLAFQAPELRQRVMNRLVLRPTTDRTITRKEHLAKECATVVEQGYSTDWGEADEGIHCVAAPIRDRHQVVDATIWVSAIAGRMPKREFAVVGAEVKKAAAEIDRRRNACE
jgi:DNA-binding IclR family transcriptional regulator